MSCEVRRIVHNKLKLRNETPKTKAHVGHGASKSISSVIISMSDINMLTIFSFLCRLFAATKTKLDNPTNLKKFLTISLVTIFHEQSCQPLNADSNMFFFSLLCCLLSRFLWRFPSPCHIFVSHSRELTWDIKQGLRKHEEALT